MALHNYESAHGALPPAVVYGKAGQPLHSWRVLILPFIEQEELYREFRLDEPWDSPQNIRLLPRLPRLYAAPGSKAPKAPPGHTSLRVFVGPGTAFEERRGAASPQAGSAERAALPGPGRGLELSHDFPDGTDRTLQFVEAGEPVPWTKPEALRYDPNGPLPELRGPFRDFFRACTADCGYRYLPYDTPEATLRALITRDAGDEPGGDG